MPMTIPYVQDLRTTATAIAVQHLAGVYGRGASQAAVEAALEAAVPLLSDAYLIEQALVAAGDEAGDPYRYLQQLQRSGKLPLRTLKIDRGRGQPHIEA